MTFAKVAGSIALTCSPLGPWGAFAFNAMLTGVDVADGTTAWKHAAVQMGVGAAAAYTGGMGGQLINIAASGIDYEEGGGVGWDNAQFKKGVVRGVATMVLTPALGGAMGEFGKTALGTGLSTGLTTFATNSLTAGDGWSIGWDGGNWQQHLTEGVASGVTAAIMQGARGKQGKDAQGRPITGTDKQPQPNVFGDSFVNKAVSGAINSSIMTMGYHAFGGNGFENNSFSKFNWNSMAYSAQDLGGFLGNKANGWVLNHYGIDKDTGVRTGSRENDNWFDKAASYLHEGSIKIDNGIKGFLNNVGKMAGDGVRDLATSVYKNVSDLLGFNKRIVISDEQRRLQESWWRSEDGQLSIMEKQIALTYYKDKDFKLHFVDGLINSVEGFKENNIDNEKINGNRFFRNYENIKNHNDYLDAKLRLSKDSDFGYEITVDDKINLSRSLNQQENSALSIQLQKEYGMTKLQANAAAHDACYSATMYAQLKLAGADVGSYSDYFKKNVDKGYIRERDSCMRTSDAAIAGQYNVDGRQLKVGYITNYDKFLDSKIDYGMVRFTVERPKKKSYDHSMPSYYDESVRRISDVSSREQGARANRLVERDLFKRFMYIR
jgi:hypothetical protein